MRYRLILWGLALADLVFWLVVFVVILIWMGPGCSFKPRPWTKGEVVLGVVSTGLVGWNAYETCGMLDRDGRELSPLMGEYPSDERVCWTMGATQLMTLAVAHWVPTVTLPVFGECELRVPLLVGKSVVNGAFALHDREIGR